MKKPIAKLREDVVKAAKSVCAPSGFSYTASHNDFALVKINKLHRLERACAALASRQKRGVK
jgi:hypothetical protein